LVELPIDYPNSKFKIRVKIPDDVPAVAYELRDTTGALKRKVCVLNTGVTARDIAVEVYVAGINAEGDIDFDIKEYVFRVSDSPNPGPNPPTPPDPVDVPAGYKNFTRVSYDAAMKIDLAAWKATGSAMAEAFKAADTAMREKIANNANPSVLEAIQALQASTDAVLGSNSLAWNDWRTAVDKQFKANFTSPATAKPDEYVQALRSVYNGLAYAYQKRK